MMAHFRVTAYHAFERADLVKSTDSAMQALLFILFAILVIGGNAIILLRTANKPKILDSAKPLASGDEDGGW
ncbi:MAG: hypothetical protein ACRERU_18795 [Methylococcales bacterium]